MQNLISLVLACILSLVSCLLNPASRFFRFANNKL